MGDTKTVKAPRGQPSGGPAKTTVDRSIQPMLWVKVSDTTALGDRDTEAHVSEQQVAQVLQDRFQWLPGDFGIDVKVEVGLFSSTDLASGPETRNQVLLANVGIPTGNPKNPLRYHEKNVANLIEKMLDLEALPSANPFEDRTLNQNLALWPTLGYLAQGTYFGVTRDNTRVSTVEFWDATLRSAAQNDDWKKHPAEWEAHVSEHEIGHTFLGPDHPADDKKFPNVMTGGFWEYEQVVYLDSQAVSDAGGPKKVSEQFFAKPNARVLSTPDGADNDIYLYYEGYPGFDKSQRKSIAETIRARLKDYVKTHPAPVRRGK